MSSSTQNLYKNVYNIVNKDSGEAIDQDQIDLEQLIDSQINQHFVIRPVRDRVSIAEQYSKMYEGTTKFSRNRLSYQTSARGLGTGQSTELIDEALRLSMPEGTMKPDTDLAKKTGGFFPSGTSLSRERISMADLKSAEVMKKIKNRCLITNPCFFDDSARSTSLKQLNRKKQLTATKTVDSLKSLG